MKRNYRFFNLFNEVLTRSEQFTDVAWDNRNNIQSSIAIIFREKEKGIGQRQQSRNIFQKILHQLDGILEAQLLFLQRKTDKSLYSGDICMPGGKTETGETPLQAAIRETQEETGIELKQDELLGMINRKFVAWKNDSMMVVTYVYVFLLHRDPDINLNADEMADFKWVSLRHFLQDEVYTSLKTPFQQNKIKFSEPTHLHDIQSLEWASVNLGLNRNLYGFTLYILGYLTSPLVRKIQKNYKSLLSLYPLLVEKESQTGQKLKIQYSQTKKELERCLSFATRFKDLIFVQLIVHFKDSSPLKQHDKEKVTEIMKESYKRYYPYRPRY